MLTHMATWQTVVTSCALTALYLSKLFSRTKTQCTTESLTFFRAMEHATDIFFARHDDLFPSHVNTSNWIELAFPERKMNRGSKDSNYQDGPGPQANSC